MDNIIYLECVTVTYQYDHSCLLAKNMMAAGKQNNADVIFKANSTHDPFLFDANCYWEY
jgi:hypothetical protein